MRRARLPAALAGAALLAGAAPADAARESTLEKLRSAIEASRERVVRYEREERGLLETVEALDRAVSMLSQDVMRARQRADEAGSTLERVKVEKAELTRRVAETKHALAVRAVALYKAGELGAIRVVFAAGDLRDFLARVYALRLLVQRDAELIATHREQSEALAEAARRAGQAAVELEEAAARLRERSAQLGAERRAKRVVVARIHESRARERGALIELETAARALEETLAALGDAPQAPAAAEAGPPFASLRGRLPSPVDAPIAQEFGRVVDAEFSTETVRKGVVFEASSGTPVRAVAAGLVRFAGWFRGYGRIVILGHGNDYFTVSGHLADVAVEVGQRVPTAGAIGTVGDTGSLSGPRLYFEVRRRGQPLDPRQWLESPDAG